MTTVPRSTPNREGIPGAVRWDAYEAGRKDERAELAVAE